VGQGGPGGQHQAELNWSPWRFSISPVPRMAGARLRNGIPSFDRIRYRRHDANVFLYAFDLIELNGDDLRREPLETRKATLASVLRRAVPGVRMNEHIEADGPTVFAHACKMGLEGIVSKRKDSTYRSGRSPDWLKSKNPACEAVRREDEEDWGDGRRR
jgi:bifunctional non-homologous end joining protein LigD